MLAEAIKPYIGPSPSQAEANFASQRRLKENLLDLPRRHHAGSEQLMAMMFIPMGNTSSSLEQLIGMALPVNPATILMRLTRLGTT